MAYMPWRWLLMRPLHIVLIRDAPIISIGRLSAVLPIIDIGQLVHWYPPIVVYTIDNIHIGLLFNFELIIVC